MPQESLDDLVVRLATGVQSKPAVPGLQRAKNADFVVIQDGEVWLKRRALHWADGALLWSCATVNAVRPEKSVLHGDEAFKDLLPALVARGDLRRGDDDDEFFRRFSQPLPDPASPSGWQLPELLSTLHGAAALSETPAPPGFVGNLFPYQQQALTWMLARERARNTPATDVLSPLWASYVAADGQRLYANKVTGTLVAERPAAPAYPRISGGILADEMGLGKTVMLASLIAANPFDPAALAGTGTQIELDRMIAAGELVLNEQPVPVKATLVTVTRFIKTQWIDELMRWIPGANVLRFDSDLQSLDAPAMRAAVAAADVVVIAYEELTSIAKPPRGSEGKQARVARSVLCDGTLWWRVVLDEAQTVSEAECAEALSASWLWKANMWATTGTPLREDLSDLHGLLIQLDYEPYASCVYGTPYSKSRARCFETQLLAPYAKHEPGSFGRLQALMQSVMLRRMHADPEIRRQAGVPEPTVQLRRLQMQPAERAWYLQTIASVYDAAGGFLVRERKREEDARTYLLEQREALTSELSMWVASQPSLTDTAVRAYLDVPLKMRLNVGYRDRVMFNAKQPEEVSQRIAAAFPAPIRRRLDTISCELDYLLPCIDRLIALRTAEQRALSSDRWRWSRFQYEARRAAVSSFTSHMHLHLFFAFLGDSWPPQPAVDKEEQRKNFNKKLKEDDAFDEEWIRRHQRDVRKWLFHPKLRPDAAATGNGTADASAASLQAGVDSVTRDHALVADLTARLAAVRARVGGGGASSEDVALETHLQRLLGLAESKLQFLQAAGTSPEGGGDCCSICLDDFVEGEDDGNASVLVPCGHKFHEPCVRQSRGNVCPLCRCRWDSVVPIDDFRSSGMQAALAPAHDNSPLSALQLAHGSKLGFLLHDLGVRALQTGGLLKCVVASQFPAVLSLVSRELGLAGHKVFNAAPRSDGQLGSALGYMFAEQALSSFRHYERTTDGAALPPDRAAVLLLHLDAARDSAAAGVNLQCATVLHLLEPYGNAGVEAQAIGRLVRVGQQRPVTVLRLVMRDTMEEEVLRAQQEDERGTALPGAGEFFAGMNMRRLFDLVAGAPPRDEGRTQLTPAPQ